MQPELIRVGSWLRRFTRWIVRPKQLWFALAVIVIAGAVALRPGTSEPLIRLTGLSLQVLGIGTVIWGIELTRRFFNHPSLLAMAVDWLKQFPPYRRDVNIAVGTANIASAELKARAYVSTNPPANATLEQRVASLEKNIVQINKRIDEGFKEIDVLEKAQKSALDRERQERTTEDVKLAARLETSGTGGLHISMIGALWLWIGVTLSTAAPELAQWLGK